MRAFMAIEVDTGLVYKIVELQKKLAEANANCEICRTRKPTFHL